MTKSFIRLLILISLLLPMPLLAGEVEDALAALDRKEFKKAFHLIKPLAEQGNPSAQYNVGMMYFMGSGVKQNHSEAGKWYQKAAEQGHTSAQTKLGLMHGRGQGVLKDYVESHKWLNIAGAKGDKEAIEKRILLERRMTPSQLAEAQKLARDWMKAH